MSQTIVELFEEQVQRSSVRAALRRHRDDAWENISWKEWWDASERFAAALIDAGVEAGDEVCLLMANRVEWAVADMGLAMSGAVSIPLHGTTSAAELAEIYAEHEIRTFVVGNPLQLARVVDAIDDPAAVDQMICLERQVLLSAKGQRGGEWVSIDSIQVPSSIAVVTYDEFMGRGRVALAEDARFVACRRREIDAETVATILYTAGVSHRARGVILTHANLAAQIEALSALQIFSSDDVQLLFLPLAHVFGRVLYLAGIAYGMTTALGRGPERLVDDLAEIAPTLMASVPRVYEKLQEEMEARVQRRGWRARLMPLALEVGKTMSRRTEGGDRVGLFLGAEHRFFSKLLLEDLRQRLGGRMRFLICGGAPLAPETAEFFFAAGVLLLQGYGVTEAAGVVSFNLPDEFRLDSVGKPLPGVDVTIGEDGEILLRGPTIMQGYRKGMDRVPGRDEEGWFHTGDLGRFDRDGFLYLTGRKESLIVTSTGAHVAPEAIEEQLCEHRLVAQALVFGEGQPYLAALLGLDPEELLRFVERHRLDSKLSVRQLTTHRRIRQAIADHVETLNQRRSPYDRVRKFAILPEFLSFQNRTLSASGQVRRSAVRRQFADELEALFDRPESLGKTKN